MSDICPSCGSDQIITIPAKAVGGGAAGALIGSVVPVIGTGLGMLIGGTAGAIASMGTDSKKVRLCAKCKSIVGNA